MNELLREMSDRFPTNDYRIEGSEIIVICPTIEVCAALQEGYGDRLLEWFTRLQLYVNNDLIFDSGD